MFENVPFEPRNVLVASYPWESQVVQYPQTNKPGVHYFAGVLPPEAHPEGKPLTVDCLLYYGSDKHLHGILNHYDEAFDYPGSLERPGNVNLWVDLAWQRRGIGSLLMFEAKRRWKIDLSKQDYTIEGLLFLNGYLGQQPHDGQS